MKVVLAESAGFCAGVKTAMRIAVDAARNHGGLRSPGPLIHNDQAVRLLELRGVAVSAAPPRPGDRLLIRAHGIHPDERRAWENLGCGVVDATCAQVARNQRLAGAAAAASKAVIIAGDPDHAEVKALLGAAGPGARAVADEGEAENLTADGKVYLLAQTTFSPSAFKRIAAVVSRRFPDAEVEDTLCLASGRRQEEARRLADRVDALVVVGGRHSANTRRLAEAGAESGKPVFLVETAAELDPAAFAACRSVGVTAGASTPGWITQAVVEALRGMGGASFSDRLNAILYVLLESRALTALSACGLALAAQFLARAPFRPGLAAAAGLYVFFAHIINRRVPDNPELRRLSGIDPFYTRHRALLLSLAWLAAPAALLLAWRDGGAALFLVAILAALAHSRSAAERMRSAAWLKDLPGSRAVLVAVGWALATAGPPAWNAGGMAGASVLAFVFLLCFGKTMVRDLYDLDSDHLMGLETLAVRLGSGRARRLAIAILHLAGAVPFAMAALSALAGEPFSSWLAYALLLGCLPEAGVFLAESGGRRGAAADLLYYQSALEGMGCLAGLLALVLGAPP